MMNISPISFNYNFSGISPNNKDPSENTLVAQKEIDRITKDNGQNTPSNKSSDGINSPENKEGKLSLSKNSKSDKKSDPKEEKKVQELKRIDAHVKAHEQAHIAAGGPYIRGGPQYSYVIGPDGNRYAVAGEVKIDVSPVPGNPDATIRKAQVIKRAALAPSDPSPQDRAVAAKADQMAMKARIEKYREQAEEMAKLVKKKDHSENMVSTPFNNNTSSDFTNIIQGGTSTLKKANLTYELNKYHPSIIHKIV